MNTKFLRLRRSCGLAQFVTAGLLALCAAESHAVSIYNVSLNTTAFSGQSGLVAFDFIGGDTLTANNTISISNLATNGALGNAAGFSLTDVGFFNEELRTLTFGTFLNFTLTLTENNAAPGADQFSLFFLDAGTFLPLLGTTDPTGANALFAIDITGAAGGASAAFDALVPNVSFEVTYVRPTGVSDGGGTLGLFTLSLLAAWVLRARLGGSCAA